MQGSHRNFLYLQNYLPVRLCQVQRNLFSFLKKIKYIISVYIKCRLYSIYSKTNILFLSIR